MSRLLVDGVVLRRGRVTILDWNNQPPLEIASGELVALVGKTGAGKTALAMLIQGLDQPSEGEIRIDGIVANRLAPQDRGVSLVMQDDSLWPQWNVARNIEFGLKCRGVPRSTRRARVDEILPVLRLDGLGARRPDELNTLQRWRVLLARALVLDPRLLVIDSAFDTRDEADGSELAAELRRVHDEQKLTSVVFASGMRECVPIADRIGVMSVNGIVQMGRPSELYQRPRSRALAEWSGPINVIPGRVESIDPRGEVVLQSSIGRLLGRCRPESMTVGSDAHALVRPEALSVGAQSGTTSNRFAATLVHRNFVGPLCHLQIIGPSEWSGAVITLRASAATLRDGQSLSCAIAPDAVFVVPATGE